MGTPGAETRAALGLKILLGCLAQLGQELGREVFRDWLPPQGQEKEEAEGGMGLPCGHMG